MMKAKTPEVFLASLISLSLPFLFWRRSARTYMNLSCAQTLTFTKDRMLYFQLNFLLLHIDEAVHEQSTDKFNRISRIFSFVS